MEELDYKKLRNIQRDERDGTALAPIPDDFYLMIEKLIRAKKVEAENGKSLAGIKELENIVKTVKNIRELREQKIVFRALRSEKRDVGGMIKDEKRMYGKVIGVLKDCRVRFEEMMQDAEPEESRTPEALKKIKMLKEIPAYKGVDTGTYGPFKLGEERLLPEREAEWLVKGRLAEVIGE